MYSDIYIFYCSLLFINSSYLMAICCRLWFCWLSSWATCCNSKYYLCSWTLGFWFEFTIWEFIGIGFWPINGAAGLPCAISDIESMSSLDAEAVGVWLTPCWSSIWISGCYPCLKSSKPFFMNPGENVNESILGSSGLYCSSMLTSSNAYLCHFLWSIWFIRLLISYLIFLILFILALLYLLRSVSIEWKSLPLSFLYCPVLFDTSFSVWV